jgi:hypothetical protein
MSAWLAVAPAMSVASSPGTILKIRKMMVRTPSAISGIRATRIRTNESVLYASTRARRAIVNTIGQSSTPLIPFRKAVTFWFTWSQT